ncbi:hypothetical protein K227x_61690 [Rubripirellula lacrimiformis]|uniref:Hpt domain protein n=1 Tax=Rubripirellula lacrimiformis TaxID=1930273 RepID=A0A517NKT7_9BACT|nr:hypothetical protein [Rubripirellula lacrimiformis]QDT07741.1 hypothetical protein K227x_61690 [Rubripirellula lacrimiformis]
MTEDQRERFASALKRLSGDEELLVQMAVMVSQDAVPVLALLRQQISESSLDDAAATGHKLKGMFSTFETGSPVAELQDVIQVCRSGDSAAAQSMFAGLEPDLNVLLGELELLSTSDDPSSMDRSS